jgi:peptidyl-prolyl cis-trans isomerase SurA
VEEALFGLEVGEISGVIESPLGVHILRRVPIREWAGAHILLQWSGCRNAPAGLKRSREEALRLAGDVLAAAARPGAEFADLARRHSEAPDRVEGGALGVFGPNEILKPLERAIDRLAPGEVGGPVETGLGFHIVRRESIPRARAAHILLRFRGVSCSEGVTRSREEALALAQEILARIRKGADFAALARKHSEDGNAARGGDLGVFLAGEMEKPFAAAVFALEVGEVSSIVETRHGLHLIQRLPEN